VVPLYSSKITRVPLYSWKLISVTFKGLSPAVVSLSRLFKLTYQLYWPVPRSLATTNGVSIDFFSSGYLDVSVLRVCSLHLWIQCKVTHKELGSPIRKFSDQSLHTAPRNLSQYTTSFIAFQCLGIRHTPLNAWFMHRKKFFLSKLNFCWNVHLFEHSLIVHLFEQSDIDIDKIIYDLKKLKV
jgi:hypothetical protein